MELVARRYRLLDEVGHGGLAVVHRALDTATGRTVALKQLKTNDSPERHATALELFEREFHTLSQLSHPRVVEVFAYHVDARSACYSMELLEGGDLRSLSPMDPLKACVLMRDVCSALCLMHSRRLVHRDISPRNIRSTQEGAGKLIDFGAMISMDTSAPAVGTPPFCAPEVVDMEPLDGRADLFSLGTSLYGALTGCQAYPARTFRALRDVWQQQPPPPSQLREEIPAALDHLVMELIQLDRRDRPAHAAEVMERLSVIAGLPLDEQLVVSQAYLKTPTLVGRDRKLQQMRSKFRDLKGGSGSSTLVEAETGLGRTRFVNACALEAQLLGLTVARVAAGDGLASDFDGAAALARQLLDAHPERARALGAAHAVTLSEVFPELSDSVQPTDDQPEAGRRSAVQHAFKQWMIEVSKHDPLVLAIDDFEQLDEPSATLVALLAHEAGNYPIAVVASSQTYHDGTKSEALSLLAELSARVALGPLSPGQSRQLLTSVFGDVPNVRFVAARLHHVAAGSPRDLLQLARHLVERGLARYQAGSWALPGIIESDELPESFTHSLRDRIERLGTAALGLAQALALVPEFEWNVEQCSRVSGLARGGALLATLDELVAASVARRVGPRYALDRAAWSGPLLAGLDPAALAALHRRTAELFSDLGMDAHVGKHLLAAGELQRGLDVLVEHARTTKQMTDQDIRHWKRFAEQLPRDYCEACREAIELCERLGRPETDRYALRARLTGVLVFNGKNPRAEMLALLEQCAHDVGLDIYGELEASGQDAGARLQEMFRRAQARYDALPPHRRVFSPMEALKPLVAALLECTGVVSNALDRKSWKSLPSLSPLSELAPSMAVMEQVRAAGGERLAGRYRSARKGYSAAIERLQQPDRAGLPDSYWHALYNGVLFARALVDVLHGSDAIIEAAEALVGDRGGLGALRLRKLHCLWHGDGEGADRLGQEFELVRLETRGHLHHEGGLLLAELWALACSDDLTRLRRVMPQLERWRDRAPRWEPVLSFARGQQCRIRGELKTALAHAREGLAKTSCGEHPLWPALAGMEVLSLVETGQAEEAVTVGRERQQAALAQGLDYGVTFINMPLSVALAKLGEHDQARALATGVVTSMLEQSTSGVPLGLAHHNLASTCLIAGDLEGFEAAAERCADIFGSSSNQALSTKYRRLMRAGRRARKGSQGDVSQRMRDWDASDAETYLTTMFDACSGANERAEVTARLLAEYSGAEQVFVYLPEVEGPRLGASVGYYEPPAQLEALVADFLDAARAEEHDATMTIGNEDELMDAQAPLLVVEGGERFHPMIIGHLDEDRSVVTALAVLALKPDVNFVLPSHMATQLSRLGMGG